MRTLTLWIGALMLWGTGCIGGGGEDGQTANCLPPNAPGCPDEGVDGNDDDLAPADTVEGDSVAAGPCGSCMADGDWYRFSQLTLTSLDDNPDHGAILVLNGIWEQDMEKGELNIPMATLEGETGELELAFGMGIRTDAAGGYCVSELGWSQTAVERDGCDVSGLSGDGNFFVYAGTAESPKSCAPQLEVPNAFPIVSLVFSGTFSSDCTQFTGSSTGAASVDALQHGCSCNIFGDEMSEECGTIDPDAAPSPGDCTGCGIGGKKSFASIYDQLALFAGGADQIKATCVTPAGEAALCVEASFVAERVDAPPACGD